MRRAATILAVCGAAAVAAGVAYGHGPTKVPPSQLPQRGVLNGVMDVKKTKLGRFNFRFHVSQYGVVTGHGEFNGGGTNYVSLTSISSLTCSANHLSVTFTGTLLSGASVPVTINATDGGPGVADSLDTFSISFGSFTKTGSPVAGKVLLKNCS
jgi:hypothetical protein